MTGRLRLAIEQRWRTLAAAIAGLVCTAIFLGEGVAVGASSLIGWNVAAVLFLVPTWGVLLFDTAADVRARAGREDENRAVMMSLIIAAAGTSLAGIVLALRQSKGHAGHGGPQHPAWILALSVSTLVFNWLIVQSLFALHYAHRYFGDRDKDGSADKGLAFKGDPPRTYRDFIYVAICIGATCQVSDFDITDTQFRNLVTVHALISFAFNTMVLALGINIVGNLMGQ